jgi:cell division protein FtsW (lipid II flippase)
VSFSYYSGTVDKIAFKWYAAHLSVVFVLLALLVLTTCDPAGAAPPWLLLAFLATLLLLSFADFIQRMRNGPKP